MLKKFECLNCHRKFEANDEDPQGVMCPHCGETNVKQLNGDSNPIIKYAILAIVFVAIVAVVVFIVKTKKKQCECGCGCEKTECSVDTPCCDSCTVCSVTIDGDVCKSCGCIEGLCATGDTKCCRDCNCEKCKDKIIPVLKCDDCGCDESDCVAKEGKCCSACRHNVILVVSADATVPVLTDKKEPGKYEFTAMANGSLEGIEYHFVLTPFNSPDKIIAQAGKDGHFKDIPASSTGSYDLHVVCDTKSVRLETSPHTISGFDKIVNITTNPKIDPMTKEQLEKILNSDQAVVQITKSKLIAKNVRITVSNPDEEEIVPSSLVNAVGFLDMGIWTRISVVSIGYNDMKQINSATFKVTRP